MPHQIPTFIQILFSFSFCSLRFVLFNACISFFTYRVYFMFFRLLETYFCCCVIPLAICVATTGSEFDMGTSINDVSNSLNVFDPRSDTLHLAQFPINTFLDLLLLWTKKQNIHHSYHFK